MAGPSKDGASLRGLHPDSYSWDYQPALTGPGFDPTTAMSYSDSGSAPCRG